jgi:hypothetical protein
MALLFLAGGLPYSGGYAIQEITHYKIMLLGTFFSRDNLDIIDCFVEALTEKYVVNLCLVFS